jgi:hypothetical protein
MAQRKPTLQEFLDRKWTDKCITPDFGETHLYIDEMLQQMQLSEDEADHIALKAPCYTMEGENGLQVYVELEHGDCMVGAIQDAETVIFRKYKEGDVIAVMPNMKEEGYKVNCYMHIGQHGACDRGILWTTKPAKPEEYKSLLLELESEPFNYRFKIRRRWPNRRRC